MAMWSCERGEPTRIGTDTGDVLPLAPLLPATVFEALPPRGEVRARGDRKPRGDVILETLAPRGEMRPEELVLRGDVSGDTSEWSLVERDDGRMLLERGETSEWSL